MGKESETNLTVLSLKKNKEVGESSKYGNYARPSCSAFLLHSCYTMVRARLKDGGFKRAVMALLDGCLYLDCIYYSPSIKVLKYSELGLDKK